MFTEVLEIPKRQTGKTLVQNIDEIIKTNYRLVKLELPGYEYSCSLAAYTRRVIVKKGLDWEVFCVDGSVYIDTKR